MAEERPILEEFAEAVADTRQLLSAGRAAGQRELAWEQRDPDWPAPTEPVQAHPAPASTSSEPAAEPAPRVRPSPRLFPARDAPPRPIPPSLGPAGGPGRWQGYGQAHDPAQALALVRDQLGDCERCGLHSGRKNIVFGVGDPGARLVVVGEAPGFHEDRLGEPFVGAAGQLLDRMLHKVIHLQREQVYIMNVLKCRPPDNRDPLPVEVSACRAFFDAQLNVIRPEVILAVGRYAAQSLLDSSRGIRALRGRWGSYRGIPVMPTYHPAYLLRLQGEQEKQEKYRTWQDLVAVQKRLGTSPREA